MQREAPSEAKAPAATEAKSPAAKAASRRPLIVLAAVVALGAGAWGVHAVMTAGEQETDDAQVEADVVPLGVRVSGQVLHLRVHDDQRVHAGDVLLELDDQELSARVAQAQAQLATAQAQADEADANVQIVSASASGGLHSAEAGVSGARDAVRSAGAQIQLAQAGLVRAQAQAQLARSELERTRGLFADHAISQAQMDAAQSASDAANASVAQAQATLSTALASRQAATTQITQAEGRLEQSAPVDTQLAAARARAALAHAKVREMEAALRLAQLNLTYATVRAPADGTISRLAVREGQLVSPGMLVANLVPATVYVVANFKETQVGAMRPGQRADIDIDALPGRTFHGTVATVSGGTGARFSLLPPDNASGNFVKVVQRVPVKIRFRDLPPGTPLQVGLSADVTVHVH